MNAEEIFHVALGRPSAERAEFLATACGADQSLRHRIEALLEAHENPGSFLARRPPMLGETSDAQLTDVPGAVIGPYKLLEQIGEGGFGVVFMAEQTEPVRRKVALKILKAGMDTRQVVARFEAERQALAIMDHPNIARVFDGGMTGEPGASATGGRRKRPPVAYAPGSARPYFVMELVKGTPITEFCDEHHLTPRQRLELFIPVCQAVQHAHQKGIIHRDLKPSNILVSRHDTTPVPKVIDFGVAKALGQELTDKTLFTSLTQMIGTPLYVSPEQAGMSDLDVDTRSDIYSLGVLLYELLTGTTPFDRARFSRAAHDEIRRIIRDEEPPKPSTRLSELGSPQAPRAGAGTWSEPATLASVSALRQTEPAKLTRLMRGELDWIVMKALEKDRNRRYETASNFAADVQHYLDDEAVEACPPSAVYRLRKFVRRNKGPVAATGLLLLTLLAGIIGTALALMEARAQYNLAQQGEVQAQQSAAEAKAVLEFFEKRVLSAARPKGQGQGLGREATIRAAVDKAEPDIAPAFVEQPLAEASIRRVLGLTYWYAGDYAKAIEQHERALALRQANLGANHPDTLNSMTNLGQAYQSAGRLTDALRLHEETLKLRQALLGPNDPETLWTMNRLADTLLALGRTSEALPLYEEELRIAKATLGPDHKDTLIYMDKLAGGYRGVGRLAEAVQLLEETLRLYEVKLPADHPDRLATMGNVALLYSEVGRWAEAIPMHKEALERKRATLGADHPETLITLHNLGVAYRDSGQRAEALPLLEEALKLHTAKMGSDHHVTLVIAFNLAWLYRDAGRLNEALSLFQETLQRQLARVGADHPNRLMAMNHTGACLLKMKKYHEADTLLRDCLARRTRVEPTSWWVSHTRSQLGQVAAGLQRHAEAEALLLEAHQALSTGKDKLPARFQGYAGEAAQGLADLYDAWGKEKQAAEWRKKLETRGKKSGIEKQQSEK